MTAFRNLTTHDIHFDFSEMINGLPANHMYAHIPCRRVDFKNQNIVLDDGIVDIPDWFLEKLKSRPAYARILEDDSQIVKVKEAKKSIVINYPMGGVHLPDFSKAEEAFSGKKPVDEQAALSEEMREISPSIGEKRAAQKSSLIGAGA